MNTRRKTILLCVVAVSFLVSSAALAGPYGDTLGKCLVSKTTSAQKTTLVRWMFAMMALHPDVQGDASITAAQRTALSKGAAQLFEQLLTESCRAEAADAVKYEGPNTIEASFALLGQVAARELFAHPRVAEGMAEFGQFVDEKKIKDFLDTPKP